MSIAIAPTQLRALAAAQDIEDTGDASAQQALPDTITDAQGRTFRLQQDPVSGLPQYRHASEQRDQSGGTLALEILITLAQDGSFTRRTTQQLDLASGDGQREQVLQSFDAAGVQVGETVDSSSREGSATTTEHTTGTFAAGQLVRRETDIVQRDEATDAKTREKTTVEARIHGTWGGDGQPVTDATVPHVDRTTTQRILSPGQGINKNTDRTITFTSHGAGPVDAIDWDDDGSLVVRFDGRGDQYIERELRVPLDQATGAPKMDDAETVRTDDRQNVVNKAMTQVRVWGGLASNLSWVIGLNFARGSLGKGMLAFSAAAAGAQLTGEVHAVATRRNDGDWTRVATSAYDVMLTGLLAAYMSGKPDARLQALTTPQKLGLGALGAAGIAANASELAGSGATLGAARLGTTLLDARLGATHLPTTGDGLVDRDWRAEPRFDAARALLAA